MTTVEDSTGHHRRHRSIAADVRHPFDHSPEVLLAVAAVLIVLAGPVLTALALQGPVVSAASVVLLGVGLALAVAAATRLLRD